MAEQVCEATRRDNPVLLYTLAVVYARTDRVPEAVATADEGLAVAPRKAEQAAVAGLRQFLDYHRAPKRP